MATFISKIIYGIAWKTYSSVLAFFCIVIGIIVLYGWKIESSALVQVYSTYAPMKVNTALCFILTGASILLHINFLHRIARILNFLVIIVVLVTGLQYILHVDFGIDNFIFHPFTAVETMVAGRMSPTAITCFTFTNMGLALLGTRSLITAFLQGISGIFVLVLSLASIFFYLSGLKGSLIGTNLTYMAIHTSLLFQGLGWLLFIHSGKMLTHFSSRHGWLLPVFVGIGGLAITACLFLALREQQKILLNKSFDIISEGIGDSIENYFDDRIKGIMRVSTRWTARGGAPKNEWLADAESYVKDHPSIQFMFKTDEDEHIIWTAPLKDDQLLNGMKLPPLKALSSTEGGKIGISYNKALFNNKTVFIIAARLSVNKKPEGYVGAVFDIDKLINTTMKRSNFQKFGIKVYHDGSLVTSENIGRSSDYTGKGKIDISDHVFDLEIFPDASFVAKQKSTLPFAILFVGLLLSALSSIATYYNVEVAKGRRNLHKAYSEMSQKEKELRRQKNLLQYIMDNSDVLIYLKDIKGKYLLVNSRFIELFCSEGPHKGFTDFDLFPADIAEHLIQNDKKIMNEKKKQMIEEVVPVKGGQKTFLSLKAPVFDTDGNFYAICGMSTDISKRIEAEKKLQSSLNSLEEINRQILEARKKAEEANIAKSAFLANMSHEIRTPLNGVIGMTELLYNTELSEKQERYVQRISSSGKMLLTLVNDILDLSKIEAGKLILDTTEGNIATLVKEVVEIMTVRTEEKNLQLSIDLDPQIPNPIFLDVARLRQILVNLVGNAVKFTEKGGVKIKCFCIKHKETDSNHMALRFEVIDTGIGITKSKFNQIFEKFSQADVSTTRKFGGTGLGLAICKQLVERMGGDIGFESEENKGSTFWFELLFTLQKKEGAKDPEWRPTCEQFSELKFLILGCNSQQTSVIKDYVGSWNIKCTHCYTGEAAVEECLSEITYDILIVDDSVQDWEAITVVNSLLANQGKKRVAILLVYSGLKPQSEVSSKVDIVLKLPFSSSELFNCVAAYFTRSFRNKDEFLNDYSLTQTNDAKGNNEKNNK
ncbi:MAG: ATP-binding protein [Parachlamydiales bacterium]|jgi:PAS domain S-box-containing protein